MADLKQIQNFIARYQDAQETVEILQKLRSRLQGDTAGVKAAIVIYKEDKQPFYRYELPLNQAANYLNNQLTSAEEDLDRLNAIVANISVDDLT